MSGNRPLSAQVVANFPRTCPVKDSSCGLVVPACQTCVTGFESIVAALLLWRDRFCDMIAVQCACHMFWGTEALPSWG